MFYPLQLWLKQRFWSVQKFTQTFHLLPIVAAVVLFLLLTVPGQMRELYLSYMESPRLVEIACAIVAFGLFSAMLVISHYALIRDPESSFVSGWVQYSDGPQPVQRISAASLALAPWAGLAMGFFFAGLHAAKIRAVLETIDPVSPHSAGIDKQLFVLSTLAMRGTLTAVIVACIGCAITYVLDLGSRSPKSRWRQVIIVAVAAMFVGFAMVAAFSSDEGQVSFFRALGPFAVTSFTSLFVFLLAVTLAYLSQTSHFPALLLTTLAIGIALLFSVPARSIAWWLGIISSAIVIAAVLSAQWRVALLAGLIGLLSGSALVREHRLSSSFSEPSSEYIPADTHTLDEEFVEWLKARGVGESVDQKGPYTVFIVAAQGGGIYAAAAASQFLSALQDQCPSFSEHVFAISAVSGGAIGATIFQTLAAAQPRVPLNSDACVAANEGTLRQRTAEIIAKDHLSPIVGAVIPDFLGAQYNRAVALEQSFIDSVVESGVPYEKASGLFSKHWSPESHVPALILNATWAETGYRVAIAPFPMGKGDGTLMSFSTLFPKKAQNLGLMEAAAISARFPGILPPQSILRQFKIQSGIGNSRGQDVTVWKRWHLVDGGYADGSGATTALDLYRALAKTKAAVNGLINIKLILLSGDGPDPDYASINGTTFDDVLAPIDAMLRVRELLALQSVTRACVLVPLLNNVAAEDKCPVTERGSGPGWTVQLVALQDRYFALPLGWKISRATLDTVSLLVGRPEYCPSGDTGVRSDSSAKLISDQQISRLVLIHNSCVMKDIQHALPRRPIERHEK